MKLVEILARELVEWSEGADWASQDKDKEIRFDKTRFDFYAESLADDAGVDFGDGVIVTRQEWGAERAKMGGKTEWGGEGLPPVGCPFELRMTNDVWITATPTAYGKKHMLFEDVSGEERIEYISKIQARPIRTPEQVDAEKREQAITDLMQTTCIRRGEAARIYDAGYRKQEKDQWATTIS